MSDNNNRISELFRKYLSGTSTASEEQEFWSYVEDPLRKKEIQEILSGAFEHQAEIESLSDNRRKRILSRILENVNPVKTRKTYNLWSRVAVAASVLLCLGAILYIYRPGTKKVETGVVFKNNAGPDSSKAYLTLANGARISLSDTKDGRIAKQSGIAVTKAADGQLVYSIADADNKAGSNAYNTVETPKGGQYQINLPDGTKVWLNAVSSLTYPVSFSSLKKRKVTLKGEGYFEVAKDKTRPFIVATDKQEVEVLGTHFNINAYNTQLIKTTLLEGAVQVSSLSLEQPAVLKPGQMAVNDNKKISIADMPYAYNEIAWKEGYFVFSNANIKDIMRDLSNWYDMEVQYEGDMSDVYFDGNYLRSRSVLKLLKSLEMINSKIRFKTEGRRITVIREK